MHLDSNKLYGWVMSQPLPMPNFKWLTNRETKELNVKIIPHNSSTGYILECDLGKYYFYYLYIHVYFIKFNVSFLYISGRSRDFIKCNVSFLCISVYPHKIHDLHKDYLLVYKRFQIESYILTQQTSIGPQDVPRTSPSNVPRTSPADPI